MKKFFFLAVFTISICGYTAAQTTPVKSKTEEKGTPKKDTSSKGNTTPAKKESKTEDVKLPIPVPASDTVNTIPPKTKGYLLRRK